MFISRQAKLEQTNIKRFVGPPVRRCSHVKKNNTGLVEVEEGYGNPQKILIFVQAYYFFITLSA